MEEKAVINTVTLKDLWGIFLHRLWIIILVSVLTVTIVFAGVTLTYEPKYTSSATLYILQQNQTTQNNTEYEDFNLALKVVNDCTHLIKSHSVLDAVIKKLDLNIEYKELYNSIKITNPPETRILEVVVESDTPQQAKKIVDEVCVVGTEKITEAMGFEQVHFFEQGILNDVPSNKMPMHIYIAIGLAAMVITYSVFLFIYFLDEKIRTDEDIKRYLGLSILGDIPNFDDNKKKKYNGRNYYRRYYRGGTYGGERNE